MNKQVAKNIIDGAKRAFCFTILRGCIGARKAKEYAVRKKESAIASIIKFTSIVTLNKAYGKTKVGENILTKIEKNWVYIGLGSERKGPNIMGIIIKNYKIVFVTRNTRNWRCP